MCAGRLSRNLWPMPTTTHKEHQNAHSLEPRTGRRLSKRLAAALNPLQPFQVALRQRNLRRLFAGLVVSQAGDWLYNLALLAFVYERTGSMVWVGITTAARILPEVVLGPIGGVLADRHDRRLVMIVADVLRAATMAALAGVALAGGPVVLAPVLAALCTAAGAAYPQCVVAVMPRLVDEACIVAMFADCDRGAVPALGMAWDVETIVDDELDASEVVYVETGDHECLLRLADHQFHELMLAARHGHFCGQPLH